ncbi:MAG: S-layer homology domain-containing protein, partial [Clostridiales bacterium]|nr:S-layer homology domain-containing protein [Clostridiales bacterium]
DNKYVEGRTYSVVQISADGSKQMLDGKCVKIGDKLYVRVSVSHLSTFVVLGGRQMKFVDVANHWAKAGIQYVFDRGIMSGTAETKFAPDAKLSRAMLVTMLHNLEGAPKPGSAAAFTDVEAGKWYADAISWAAANGIVSGVGEGKFAPNDNITREQIATILHNYAKYKKYDVTKAGDLTVFADSADISDWALPAMKWANAEGLIKGRTKSTMVPKGIATRAEAAVIITFFLENVVK